MSFLKEHCSLFSVNEPKELDGFNCGDLDIDEFFALDFATAVQASVFNGNRAARTGYVRLVRLITDEPVPQQTTYTGKIELR